MRYFFFLILIFLFSGAPAFAQCDNLKPMYGDRCVKTAKLLKADAQFRKAALKQYGSADSATQAYVRKGWQNFYNRNAAAAMKNFNQAWLIDKENPAVYFGFGHLVRYAFAKNAPEAEKYYKLGRDRDPDRNAEKNSLIRLLNSFDYNNEPEAAIDVSSQLIQGFPDYALAHMYAIRAYYYTTLQMPERAVKDYEKALQTDPKNAELYVGRGYAYSWLRNQQQALADYNQAIALDPKSAQAYAYRAALTADSLNQPEAGLADIEKALQLNSRNAEYYKIKSNILFKLNRKTEACDCLKNGMKINDKSLAEAYKSKCSGK